MLIAMAMEMAMTVAMAIMIALVIDYDIGCFAMMLLETTGLGYCNVIQFRRNTVTSTWNAAALRIQR